MRRAQIDARCTGPALIGRRWSICDPDPDVSLEPVTPPSSPPTPSSDRLQRLLQRAIGYAASLTGDEHTAADLVQEACSRLVDRRGPWVAPYLLRVVRNLFIDGLRRDQRLRFVRLAGVDRDERAEDPLAQLPDPRSLPRPALLGDAELAQAFSRLSPAERELLWLHVVEDRSTTEIAAFVDRPRNTVASQIRRALLRLRERLAGSEADPSTARTDPETHTPNQEARTHALRRDTDSRPA
jgi:RNA polymerase sigma factor (sigma-70 family)